MAQLELLNLSVHFGGVKAVQNVSIRVEQGEFRGLIDPMEPVRQRSLMRLREWYSPLRGTCILKDRGSMESVRIKLPIWALPVHSRISGYIQR